MRPLTDKSVRYNHIPSIAPLRARLAVNHFKRQLLGNLHVPGKSQAEAVFDSLEQRALVSAPLKVTVHDRFDALGWIGFRLTQRAWEGWFGGKAVVPRRGKMTALDNAAQGLLNWRRPADGVAMSWPSDFYFAAVHGGLMSAMLADTEARIPSIDLLRARARAYSPVSAWHLHLDALELGALVHQWRSIPYEQIVEIAGHRILEELHRMWRPDDGTIYDLLSAISDRWWMPNTSATHTLSQGEKFRLNEDSPALSMRMPGDAMPNWYLAGVDPDITASHVYQLLFAIGADGDFLQDDRLAAWALDFATGGIAARALAWVDRDRSISEQFTDKNIFLMAIGALLLSESSHTLATKAENEDAHLREFRLEIEAAMNRTGGDWRRFGTSALFRARSAYLQEMAELNISSSEIQALTLNFGTEDCHLYGPQRLPW